MPEPSPLPRFGSSTDATARAQHAPPAASARPLFVSTRERGRATTSPTAQNRRSFAGAAPFHIAAEAGAAKALPMTFGGRATIWGQRWWGGAVTRDYLAIVTDGASP